MVHVVAISAMFSRWRHEKPFISLTLTKCNKFEKCQGVNLLSVLPFKPVAKVQIDQREERVDNYAFTEQVNPPSVP